MYTYFSYMYIYIYKCIGSRKYSIHCLYHSAMFLPKWCFVNFSQERWQICIGWPAALLWWFSRKQRLQRRQSSCFTKEAQLQCCRYSTVDGSEIRLTSWYGSLSPLFTWFYASQVVVWDFWTINSMTHHYDHSACVPRSRCSLGRSYQIDLSVLFDYVKVYKVVIPSKGSTLLPHIAILCIYNRFSSLLPYIAYISIQS